MAFHVRLASSPDLTEHLVDMLAVEPGVTHVVVLPGSARRPGGDTARLTTGPPGSARFDAVRFDVPNRSANAVFGHLRAIRDSSSSIAIVDVDAILGEEPDPAAMFGFVQRDAAPDRAGHHRQRRGAASARPGPYQAAARRRQRGGAGRRPPGPGRSVLCSSGTM